MKLQKRGEVQDVVGDSSDAAQDSHNKKPVFAIARKHSGPEIFEGVIFTGGGERKRGWGESQQGREKKGRKADVMLARNISSTTQKDTRHANDPLKGNGMYAPKMTNGLLKQFYCGHLQEIYLAQGREPESGEKEVVLGDSIYQAQSRTSVPFL